MKARGVSFAVEAITNFVKHQGPESEEFVSSEHAEQLYQRMERVVLSRINEFIPHYLVKVICSFAQAGHGSGELFDRIIEKLLPAVLSGNSAEVVDMYGDMLSQQRNVQHGMKYSDMIRFFEVYPDVTYIFDSTMTDELYSAFLAKL